VGLFAQDTERVLKRKRTKFKNRRRKHRHWEVTVYYGDGETFARAYIELERARPPVRRAPVKIPGCRARPKSL